MRFTYPSVSHTLCCLLFIGCSSGTSAEHLTAADDAEPSGMTPSSTDAGPSSAGATGQGEFAPDAGPGESSIDLGSAGDPMRLTRDAMTVVGTTDDGHVIYRSSEGLSAIEASGDGAPMPISQSSGSVEVRQDFVFLWKNVDWEQMAGNLTIWSPEHGSRDIGKTLFGEDTIAVSESGSHLLFFADLDEKSHDLMIASSDLSSPQPLIEDVGRGSEETCRASIGFAGDEPVVGWCPVGSKDARVQRFRLEDGKWGERTLSSEVRPAWSADESGERFLFITNDSRLMLFDGEQTHPIDSSVGWGMLLPEGGEALYTVGDQLRRSPVPNADPMTVVVNDFMARARFSPDYAHTLYSTEITYEGATRRDLYLANISAPNEKPLVLVPDPSGAFPQSAFTSDGTHALYLSEVEDSGSGVLNMQPVSGGAARTVDDVDTVLAAREGRVVFSAERSDPEQYPIVADLYAAHPSAEEPVLLRNGVSSGRDIALTARKDRIVYVMPRDEEPEQDRQGLYIQALP